MCANWRLDSNSAKLNPAAGPSDGWGPPQSDARLPIYDKRVSARFIGCSTNSPSVFAFSKHSFSRSSLQTNPSTLEYFFCAMGPLMPKPSTDFASVARRALGVVGKASDASDHPDHLEIVNVSPAMSPQRPLQSLVHPKTACVTWSSRSRTTKPGSPISSPAGNSPPSNPATPPALHSLPPLQHSPTSSTTALDLLTVREGQSHYGSEPASSGQSCKP